MSDSPLSSDPHRSDPRRADPQPSYPDPGYGQPSYQQPYGQPSYPPQYGRPSPYGPSQPQPYGSSPPQPYGPAEPAVQWPGQEQPVVAPSPYEHAVQPYQQPATPDYHGQHIGTAYPAPVSGQLVSAGGRFGAVLLDGLLMVVTLWIGWLIWSLFTWSDGQSPAKKMLGHVVADPQTGQPFDWGRMALRELCVKGLLGTILNVISIGVYSWVDALMIFGERQRTLHDRMAGSIVRHR